MKKVAMLFMANQLPNENMNIWKVGNEYFGKPITEIMVLKNGGDLMSHYMIYCGNEEVVWVNASHVETIHWEQE